MQHRLKHAQHCVLWKVPGLELFCIWSLCMLRVSWGFFCRWFHKLALNVSVRVNHAGRFIKIKLRKKIWENLGNKTMISLFRKVKHWLFNIAFWVMDQWAICCRNWHKYLHFNRLTSKNKPFFKGLDGLRETWCCSERWRVELQHLGGARTHSASQAKLWQSRTRLHSGQGENLVSSAQETTVKLSPHGRGFHYSTREENNCDDWVFLVL